MTFATATTGAGGGVPLPEPEPPPPPVDIALDSFSRTVSSGIQPALGTSDSGHTWSYAGGDSNPVSMGSGYLRFHGPTSGAGGSGEQWALTLGNGFAIANLSALTRFEFRVRWSHVHSPSNELNLVHITMFGDADLDIELGINSGGGGWPSNGYVEFVGSRVAKTNWLTNTWYIVRVDTDAVTGAVRMKLWPEGEAEPGTYLIEDTGYGWPGTNGPGEIDVVIDIDAFVSGGDVFGQTIDLDYITYRT